MIRDLLSEADVVIAQNGDAFDVKKINTRLLLHRISPPDPYVTIDTKKVAKKYFWFNSYSLDDMGKDMDEGEKVKHRGFEMWKKCMAGDAKAWRDMKRYNVGDVDLLAKIYLRQRDWIANHPHVSSGLSCPRCGSVHLQGNGLRRSRAAIYNRYRCVDCGTACQSIRPEPGTRHVVKPI